MAYQPPHLRKKSESHPFRPRSEKPKTDDYSIRDIQHHYWKRDENDETSMPQHSTLNDSLEEQGSLTHVLLFHGANPRWLSDRIIFVKSNLEILPEYREAKVKRAAARPGDSSAGTEEQGAQETRTVTEEEDDSEPTDEGIRQRQRRQYHCG